MKRILTFALAATLALALLAGCGGGGKTVDLGAFFDTLSQEYQWEDGYFAELDEETLAATYPGLEDYALPQQVMKVPMMSAVVNEYVFLECESKEDAEAVAAILQERVTAQAEGGAWYPASMEAWQSAKVLTNGAYVALIASQENQADIEAAWNALFE